MPTPLLDITTIATGSSSKEALISEAFTQIEDALQRGLIVSLSGDVTLTTAQWTRNSYFICNPVSGSRNLTVPNTIRLFLVKNDGVGTLTVRRATGATVVLAAGEAALLFNNGTDILQVLKQEAVVVIPEPNDIGLFVPGKPTDAGVIARYVFVRGVEFADNFAGSYATADVASTGTAVFNINKNGTTVGTVTFSSSATGVLNTVGTTVSFAAGDTLSIVAPTPQDGTLENVSITLLGVRL